MQIAVSVTVFYAVRDGGTAVSVRTNSHTIDAPSDAAYQACVRETVEAALAEDERAGRNDRRNVQEFAWAIFPGPCLVNGRYKPQH